MEPIETPPPDGPPTTRIDPDSAPEARPWALALGLAALGGLVAWAAGEGYVQHFRPPQTLVQTMGGEVAVIRPADQAVADTRNAAVGLGLVGAATGLALGLAGGLARRSARSAILAGLAGLILGGAAGAGATAGLLPAYFREKAKEQDGFSTDLGLPVLIHGSIFAAAGLSAGLALGLGAGARGGRLASAALGGLVGGAIGAVAYELIGATLFPNANTNHPIAGEWPPRLLAATLAAITIAATSTFALVAPRSRSIERERGEGRN